MNDLTPKLARLSLLTFLISTISFAAEQPADADNSQSPASPPQQQEEREQNKSSDTTSDTNRGDIFKPSEEISEDFAVSFPVDI